MGKPGSQQQPQPPLIIRQPALKRRGEKGKRDGAVQGRPGGGQRKKEDADDNSFIHSSTPMEEDHSNVVQSAEVQCDIS